MKITTLGIDLAKDVFQLHGVDRHGKIVLQKKLGRKQLPLFLAQLPPCLIGMEACAGSHYWAWRFQGMGHTVRLMHARYVKPYVKTNKNDAQDAEAICEAVTRPHMRFVPMKTVEQQELSALLTVRSLLVRQRTALVNQIRGLFGELGIVFPKKAERVLPKLAELLDPDDPVLTPFSKETFRGLRDDLDALTARIGTLDRTVERLARTHPLARRVQAVPGIGPLSAVALIALLPEASYFDNSRHLAAWLGLVPRQHSSGGKSALGRISKRGNTMLRTLLIHGARSVLRTADRRTDALGVWIRKLKTTRGTNKAAVALAHKNARIVWALLSREVEYTRPA
jgi:transposase